MRIVRERAWRSSSVQAAEKGPSASLASAAAPLNVQRVRLGGRGARRLASGPFSAACEFFGQTRNHAEKAPEHHADRDVRSCCAKSAGGGGAWTGRGTRPRPAR